MRNRFEQLKDIFTTALEFSSPEERNGYVAEICGDDPELRAEVESLLSAHQQADGYLQPLLPPFQGMQPLSAPAEPFQQIGPYIIRESLGEGGMGIVYVAEQVAPVRRQVALKIIKPGMDSREVIARFEAERQVLAMMSHPHIAKVLDGGTTPNGRPYFVMELVHGVPITQFCDQRKLRLRDRLELFMTVCQAVQHAHQKGVIHRDLKPNNILVEQHDTAAVPKVIDFGIAKAINQQVTQHTIHTQFSQMVGTPLYMSPEQADRSGLDIDTRSDVYSLGVILYELLTGTTPFAQARRREVGPSRPSHKISTLDHEDVSTLSVHRQTDPRRLSLSMRRELDWIVMKALANDRTRRYESASALAQDIRRYLHDEPVEACPPSVVYRLKKTAKRHKGLLAAASLVLLTAIIGMLVSLSYARKATIAAKDAKSAQIKAEKHAIQADEHARVADQSTEQSQMLLYASDMKLVSDAVANRDIPRAAELLARHVPKPGGRDLRGFEWYFYQSQVHQTPLQVLDQGAAVDDVEISPDGRWFATTAHEGSIHIYEMATWTRHKSWLTRSESINGLAWSPNSQQLAAACADGSCRIWDIATDSPILKIPAHEGIAKDVAFSRDGRRLYSCGDDHLAKAWDARTGEAQLIFAGHDREVEQIDLSPDGKTLATASSDRSFALWDAQTAKRIHKKKIPHEGRFVCVRFSPDGNWLAAGNITGSLFLADVQSGDHAEQASERDGIEALSFVGGGKWLATADRGGTIQFHPVPLKLDRPVRPRTSLPIHWMAHEGRAISLATTADGRGLVSGGRDGIVRMWSCDLPATRSSPDYEDDQSDIATGLSNRLYRAGGALSIWDLDRRRELDSFAAADPSWNRVACSQDGRFLAAVRLGQLAACDLASREMVVEWPLDPRLQPKALAISPDGRWIAFAEYTDREFVTVYDRSKSQPPRQFPARQCECVAFSPDGRWLAAGRMDDVHLFDLQARGKLRVLKGHSSTLSDIAFSPDGRLLASVSHDRLLKIWRMETGMEQFSIVALKSRVRSVAFSPDGRTIAVAGDDHVLKLWHAATGQPLGEMVREANFFRKVRFSADGLKLIGQDRTSRCIVYDASFTRLSPPPKASKALTLKETDL